MSWGLAAPGGGGDRRRHQSSKCNSKSYSLPLYLIFGHHPVNNLLFFLLGLIPHIMPRVGFLEPLNPGLGELENTVPRPIRLPVHPSVWNHVQIMHMEADDTQNAGGNV